MFYQENNKKQTRKEPIRFYIYHKYGQRPVILNNSPRKRNINSDLYHITGSLNSSCIASILRLNKNKLVNDFKEKLRRVPSRNIEQKIYSLVKQNEGLNVEKF